MLPTNKPINSAVIDPTGQDPTAIPFINLDASRNNVLFHQKLLPDDEAEEKVQVPGDIKLLFEAMDEKISEYDGQMSPSAGLGNWEKSEGDLSPGGFNQRNGGSKPPGLKVVDHSRNRNGSLNNQARPFSPNIAIPNHSSNSTAPRIPLMAFSQENPKDLKLNFATPKKLSESEELFIIQKIPFSSVKDFSQCNLFCPFCSKIVEKTENSDSFYAYGTTMNPKKYLTHVDCYANSHKNASLPQIIASLGPVNASVSLEPSFFGSVKSSEVLEDFKKTYFVVLEGFHPISSCQLFKIEKICKKICTGNDGTQFLNLNFESKNSLFELSSNIIPFNEFRLGITIHQTHSQEDAYHYEFNVDLSTIKEPSDEAKDRTVELIYHQGGHINVMLNLNVHLNTPREEFLKRVNQKTQFYNPHTQNTLVSLVDLGVILPLRRIPKEVLAKPVPQHETQSQNSRLKIFKDHETSTQEVMSNNSSVFSEVPFITTQKSGLKPNIPFHPEIHSSLKPKACLTADNSPISKIGLSPKSKFSRIVNDEGSFPAPFEGFSAYTNNVTAVPEPLVTENITTGSTNTNATPMKQGEDIEGEFKLEENLDKLPQFAKTYRGSKVLQEFLVKASKQDLDKVTVRIANNVVELMLDPYANYMIQILAKQCSAESRLLLLQKISPSIVRIACDKKGTYALQTIVSLINSNAEDYLMKSALSSHVLELSLDVQGNHVIQKLINAVSLKNIDFIYQPLLENFLHVATHSAGSLVFKQLIIKVEKLAHLKNAIVQIVYQEMENLVQDPYGNYVIQYVLEYYPKDCLSVQQKIVNKLIPYSSQKFSSNIIEKSLAVGDSVFRKKIASEILKNERLADLLKNKYGNYVILHTLAVCDSEDKQSIMQGIHKCVYSFQGTKYKLRWVKFLDENPLNIPWNTPSPMNIRSPFSKGNGIQPDQTGSFTDIYEARIVKESPEEDLKRLEIVKKIWRDMNKEEKKDSTPQSRRADKNFHGFEDFSDNGSPCHHDNNMANFYQEPFSFYLNTNKVDDPRLKWF